MPKPAFKPYQQRQLMLLPPDISELVPEDSVARVVDAVVEALDRGRLESLYPGGGAPAHDPSMMLKVVLYAYASGVYSSRKIARATRENVCFMWLTGMTPLDHMTVNRFRSERIRPAFEAIFTELVALLAEKGMLDLSTYFLDGTKVEANANRYTFVWRKAVEGNRAKLQAKVRAHLEEVDRLCESEESLAALLPEESAEVTSGDVARVAGAINARLEGSPKSRPLKRAKRLVERDFLPRLEGYESRVAEIGGGRGSLSKTDPDATFMRMKEDHMGNGQLKAGYNVCLVKHAFRKCADEIFGFVLETFSGFVTPVPGPAAAAAGRTLLERYRAVDVGRGRADRQEHLDAAGVARRRGGGDLDGAPGQERRRTRLDRPVRPVPQERLGQLPGRHRAPPFPSIRESSSLWLGPPNSTSLPWCTTRSTIAAASLSSANTVPHLLNSTFVVNTTLLLS